MEEFKGKKVLLIAPLYHSYYLKLKSALEELGNKVFFFSEEPTDYFSTNFYFSRLRKFSYFKKVYTKKVLKLNKYILTEIRGLNFDSILIIKGDLLTDEFYQELNSLFPGARKTLYQWDSLKSFNYLNIVKYFDKIYSFDYLDASSHDSINYLPLFYTTDYEMISQLDEIEFKYDAFFLGINHSEREKILKEMILFFDAKKIKYSFNLMTSLSEKIRLSLETKKINCFLTSKPFSSFSDDYLHSKIIIDISFTNQTGLPIRIIEAIGANKKIVTTNYNIVREAFYNKNVVFLWGRDDPQDFVKFLNCNHERINSKNYSIQYFVSELLN